MAQGLHALVLSGMLLCADLSTLVPKNADPAVYFEGRWAFAEDSCESPANWTLIAGGNFVSEDLIGTWKWADEKLTLDLTDLALDEETGEQGGKFQMEGPVEIVDDDNFKFTIEPDVYEMKRCNTSP